jgi:ubiquinone/menaquinone biosynthesis C-methylase UbiE
MTQTRVDRTSLAAAYGQRVDLYDALWSPVIKPGAAAAIRELDLSDAGHVLDIGAGTGALTPNLRTAAPAASIVSIDAAPKMLRHAREQRNATAVLADAGALPVNTASVDAVLLAYVLFHLVDPRAGVREAFRVLRVGGQVGTVTWASESPANAARVFEDVMNELGVPILPAHGNHSELDSPDAIASLLQHAGFTPQKVWTESIAHSFEPDGLVALRMGSGGSGARLAAANTETRDAVLREARQRLASLGPDDYVFTGEVVCAVAQRTRGAP